RSAVAFGSFVPRRECSSSTPTASKRLEGELHPMPVAPRSVVVGRKSREQVVPRDAAGPHERLRGCNHHLGVVGVAPWSRTFEHAVQSGFEAAVVCGHHLEWAADAVTEDATEERTAKTGAFDVEPRSLELGVEHEAENSRTAFVIPDCGRAPSVQ